MTQKYFVFNHASASFADVLFQLKNLDLKYFPWPWDFASWDKVFNDGSERVIIVDQYLGEVRGFILFEFNCEDSFAHLLKILINPKSRGLKVGKHLLNEGIRILQERGVAHFFLEVEELNTVARNLYESVGFKSIHKKKQFYTNGSTAIIMTLDS